MKRKTNQISHPSALNSLSTLPWQRMAGRGRVVIADESVPEKTRLEWEQQLNHHYFACGCDRAALGLALGVLGYAAWVLVRPGHWASIGTHDILPGIGTVILAAVAGKLIGLAQADRKLRHLVRDIQAKWQRPRTREGDVSICG